MKFIIAEIGAKQHKLEEGKTYKFDRFDGKIDRILFYQDEKTEILGSPYVSGVVIKAEKVEDKKDKKVEIRRYRAKSRYRKVTGHRQPVTMLKVTNIQLAAKS